MGADVILQYVETYGYIAIFICLFLGIVGIPAPEESLIIVLGLLVAHEKLSLVGCIIAMYTGAFSGMICAYMAGFFLGYPFIAKYGKYIGINEERWTKVNERYKRSGKWTVLFGFYVPVIRQVSPYIAGITKLPFLLFVILSAMGTVLWITPFFLVGYFIIDTFHIPFFVIPLVATVIFFGIIASFFVKRGKKRDVA